MRAAEHGSASAQQKVARTAFIDNDYTTAVKYYEMAVHNDEAPKDKVSLWMYYLSLTYRRMGDAQAGEKWRKKSAERGCQKAKDADGALRALIRARADGGDAEACATLSAIYFDENDEGEGRKWLLKAANLGHGRSAFELHEMHEKGTHGFTKNIAKAALLLRHAAEANDPYPTAMAYYGACLFGSGYKSKVKRHIGVDHAKGRGR